MDIKYTPEESYLLYSMYSELFFLSINANKFRDAKSYYCKIKKYFGIFSSFFKYNNNINDITQEMKKNLEVITNIASTKFNTKNLIFDDKVLDEFELNFKNNNKEYTYKTIAELLDKKNARKSAAIFAEKVITKNPKNYSCYKIIGKYYVALNNCQQAIKAFEQYIKYCSTDEDVYVMLGFLYQNFGKYENLEKRINYLEKAIAIDAKNSDALRGLAIAYKLSGKIEKSISCYEKLIKIQPIDEDYASYAYLCIRLGNFSKGLKYLDYRFTKTNAPVYYPQIDKPKWNGESLENKTLLVHYEQGYGDSIQFYRYLTKINAENIIFYVQDELYDLLKINSKNVKIISSSTPLSEISFDYHIPLLSLLHITNADINNIPMSDGYIKSDNGKTKLYKDKFFNNDKFKIGIAWQGLKSGNNDRNIPLNVFKPLTELDNIELYSIQKGADEELQKNISDGMNIIDIGISLDNFSDTAAIISNLDLVISSDNVILNLAGAMNKESFLLLNFDSNWRWFEDRKETPWYKSVKIFKQNYIKEPWDKVFTRAINELPLGVHAE